MTINQMLQDKTAINVEKNQLIVESSLIIKYEYYIPALVWLENIVQPSPKFTRANAEAIFKQNQTNVLFNTQPQLSPQVKMNWCNVSANQNDNIFLTLAWTYH